LAHLWGWCDMNFFSPHLLFVQGKPPFYFPCLFPVKVG
jgi:hypothetical protein